jgi:hypothetical protein
MKCPSCNFEDDAKFCPNCGMPMGVVPPPETLVEMPGFVTDREELAKRLKERREDGVPVRPSPPPMCYQMLPPPPMPKEKWWKRFGKKEDAADAPPPPPPMCYQMQDPGPPPPMPPIPPPPPPESDEPEEENENMCYSTSGPDEENKW